MKKKMVQDVIPPKKSIRNVTIGGKSPAPPLVQEIKPVYREIKTTPKEKFEAPAEDHVIQPIILNNIPPTKVAAPVYDYEYERPKKSSRKLLYGSIVILVLAGAFAVSAFFKSAEIKITPRQETRALNETLSAKKDVSTGGLSFQVVTITKDVEKTIPATGEQQVSTKAKGRIIIYNNFSTAPQKLIATTRFETPEGLIFRLPTAVSIPGRQTKDGKTVAGSIEVAVEADQPGATYNVGLKDFTIPGLKGDPKFNAIYARSKTEMSGGFVGVQKVVSSESLSGADKEMETLLKDSLSKDIMTQIPANFVLYSTSLSYKFEPATQLETTAGSSSGATLKKRGTANAIIFDKGEISRIILSKIAPEVQDSVKISNLESLEFEYVGAPPVLSTDTTANFNLRGNVDITWVFDENKLKSDLLGLSKKEAKTIIGTFGTIKEAWVETHPFWNQTIPSNPEQVTIVNTAN